MKRIFVTVALLCVCSFPAVAKEMAGVAIDEQVSQASGTVLQFNGAGIRKKFMFKVYLAMLYLENPQGDSEAAIGDPGGKQLIMHFLYSEVGKDDLVEAWNAGFSANGSPDQLESLKAEIAQFNEMFETVKKGDRIFLDYVPGEGTTVSINTAQKGTVAGKEFNDLLLAIWLGEKPVGKDLRKALLGN